MRSIKLVLAAAALSLAAAAPAGADSWGPATPDFNLEVILRPAAGSPNDGFGLVKFRQPKDEVKVIYLDTWVRDLAPNRAYSLERAVDTNVPDRDGRQWDRPSGSDSGRLDGAARHGVRHPLPGRRRRGRRARKRVLPVHSQPVGERVARLGPPFPSQPLTA